MTQIRKCVMEDIRPLIDLFDGYRVFYKMNTDKVSAEKFLADRIKNQDAVIYVAENEAGDLIGFVQLYPIFSSTRMKRLWLLNDLYVEPSKRGKGISKKLIQQVQQLCIDTESCGMILETAKSNRIGNKLYPATGFKLDTDHNYYFWNC